MSGITPTYMGNTFPEECWYQQWWDHPHVHGEYHPNYGSWLTDMGSPPRTWGIPLFFTQKVFTIGITPTYMGNT